MKKILLSILALCCVIVASAQELAGYTAVTSEGTYTPLEEGTVVNSGIASSELQGRAILSDANAEERTVVTGKGFPIGFEFPFNGQNFTYFGVGANGLIKLSTTEEVTMKTQSPMYYVASEDGGDNVIFSYDAYAASYDKDEAEGMDTTQISYKTTDDELIVEFKNLGINTSGWSKSLKGTYNLQIHLMQDGRISYVYSGLSNLDVTNAGQVYLGLRGDYGVYTTWNDGLAATNRQFCNGRNFRLSAVADGYTITLNTPAEIVAPTTQPTDLTYTVSYHENGTANASAKFTACEADKYLMMVSEGAPTALPADGTEYAVKDSLGNAYIMSAGVASSYGSYTNDLKHATKYTITVYAYNSFGKGTVKYNTVDPLQVEFTTACEKPSAFNVVSTAKDAIEVTVAANAANNLVYVVYNDSTWNPGNYGPRAFTGTPDASLKPGDDLYAQVVELNRETWENDTTIVKAGKVAYFGESGTFKLENLKNSRSYYFIAYSYDPEAKTFSQGADTLQIWTSTNIVPPYEMDLTPAPDSRALGGWDCNPSGYNVGFIAADQDYPNVESQIEGGRAYECENQEKDVTYTIATPLIELTNDTLSLDWHIHTKTSGWFAKKAVYEEWNEDDLLQFVLYVDGQEIVLKKYNYENAPVDETDSDWHHEQFYLGAYALKNAKFGVKWLCANSNRTFFGFENLKITEGEAPVTSPYASAEAPTEETQYFLYNVRTGKWLGDNDRNSVYGWTSHAEIGTRGRLFGIVPEDGGYRIDPHMNNNRSLIKDGLWMDTNNPVTIWTLTPTMVPGINTPVYTITSGDQRLATNQGGDMDETANYNTEWMLVSSEERMKVETANASEENPAVLGWAINGGNFTVADGYWDTDWVSNFDGGNNVNGGDGTSPYYMCNRARESWNSNSYDFHTVVKNLPNGKYTLNLQGYYRDGAIQDFGTKHTDGTEVLRAKYYANDKEATLQSIIAGGADEKSDNRYYYNADGKWVPDNLQSASAIFFEGGYWNEPLTFYVTDGTATLGCKKADAAAYDWTAVDNFTISYLGEKYPVDFSADYDEMCDEWGVYADGQKLEYPYDNDNPYSFAAGTQISVGGICTDALHHMVVTVNGEEVPEEAFDPDTKTYTFELTQPVNIKVAFKMDYTLNFSADYDEMCDEWGVYANGQKLEYPYDNDNPYKFVEGTQISVGGSCTDALHQMYVYVNDELVPDDAFDPDTKVYTFTLAQDTNIKIEFKQNYTLNFSAEYDENCDQWGVYADGQKLEYPYDKENPYKFVEGTQISVGGICIDAAHTMVVTVNGEEVPEDAFDPDTKVYTFTLAQDTEIKIVFKNNVEEPTWTATGIDYIPEGCTDPLFAQGGNYTDLAVEYYETSRKLVIKNFMGGDQDLTLEFDEDGNPTAINGEAFDPEDYNSAWGYTGNDTYYGAWYYSDCTYVSLDPQTGYVQLAGWYYDNDNNAVWATYAITWDEGIKSHINGVDANADDNAPVYNIGGQRVKSNAKGIVIKNGRKYIQK